MDSLNAMRIFARVVESGSYTDAATSLNFPLATVRKLIYRLEQHLQVRLLRQTTRKVVLTAEGDYYYARTILLVRALDAVHASYACNLPVPMGKLRIATDASLASSLIAPALPQFQARYPGFQIELASNDRSGGIFARKVDCSVRAHISGAVAPTSGEASRLLGQAALITCAAPDYLLRHGTPEHPDDILRSHRVVGVLPNLGGRAIPLRFGTGAASTEVAVNDFLVVSEGQAHLAAGLAGLGLIQGFDYQLKPYLERGDLVQILQPWSPAPLSYYMVYMTDHKASRRLELFMDWLEETFKGRDR